MAEQFTPAAADQISLQDLDLLQRLSLYFDSLDTRLRQGQGWFIFNATSHRSRRIASFVQQRLHEYSPPVTYSILPWRDFALNAYVQEVGLPDLAPQQDDARSDPKAKREYELAVKLTHNLYAEMISADVLVLSGLKPAHRWEAILLDQMVDGRYRRRGATILLTPDMPQQLETEFEQLDPTRTFWGRIFERMYETSLVAL